MCKNRKIYVMYTIFIVFLFVPKKEAIDLKLKPW